MQATITKTKSAEPVGTYNRTSLDDAKDAADIRIVGHFRNRTVIESRRAFQGHGIKREAIANGTARYLVSDEAMIELRRRYSVVCDF